MATITRYVNTASSAGGDGTTNATSGVNRAYASLNEWEAAEQTDLVTAGDVHIVICEGSAADTAAVGIAGWTTDATHYIEIRTDAAGRHNGAWDISAYRLDVDLGGGGTLFYIWEDYVRVDGIQFRFTATGAINVIAASSQTATDNEKRISNCIITSKAGYTARGLGIMLNTTNIFTLYIWNNIIYNMIYGADGLGIGVDGTSYLYNNTIKNCSKGIWAFGSGVETVKNCVVFDNTDDFVGTFTTIDYCASDDNDGTNNVVESSSDQHWTSDFTDAANGDFTLKSTSNLVGGGVNDPGSGLFSDDIVGASRTSTWDIGAHEFIAAAGGIGLLNIERGAMRGANRGVMRGV